MTFARRAVGMILIETHKMVPSMQPDGPVVLRAQINLAQLMANDPGSSKPVANRVAKGLQWENTGVERASGGDARTESRFRLNPGAIHDPRSSLGSSAPSEPPNGSRRCACIRDWSLRDGNEDSFLLRARVVRAKEHILKFGRRSSNRWNVPDQIGVRKVE
jgi:hypothetical protein